MGSGAALAGETSAFAARGLPEHWHHREYLDDVCVGVTMYVAVAVDGVRPGSPGLHATAFRVVSVSKPPPSRVAETLAALAQCTPAGGVPARQSVAATVCVSDQQMRASTGGFAIAISIF